MERYIKTWFHLKANILSSVPILLYLSIGNIYRRYSSFTQTAPLHRTNSYLNENRLWRIDDDWWCLSFSSLFFFGKNLFKAFAIYLTAVSYIQDISIMYELKLHTSDILVLTHDNYSIPSYVIQLKALFIYFVSLSVLHDYLFIFCRDIWH